MLTPDQIAALRDRAFQITDPINDYLLEDIARRISEAGQLTSTAAYQVWRAQQMGLSQREIQKRLQKLLRVSQQKIKQLLTQSAEAGYNFDISRLPYACAVPFRQNAVLQHIVSTAVDLAQEDFTNLTQTLGMVDPYGNVQPLQAAYRACTDFAFKQVITGAADYGAAIRQATRNLAAKGVRVIDYESGVHTSLEAAVRRNIMGGLGLMQEQISRANHDTLGCDGWEITAHANSAPDHEPIQGRQYSDAAYEALNSSLVRRIGTLNCGHAAFPILLGVNSPQYTPEELEKLRTDNEKGVTVDGKHYTGYEATQMQRKLERAIRSQKRRVMIDEAAGDGDKLRTDRVRLTRLNQEYERFSKAAKLKTQYERTEVAGFTPPGGSAILKDTEGRPIPVTDEAIQRVPLVTPDGWSEERAVQLQEAHRELLRCVKDEPVGTEAGAVYSTDMRLIERTVGTVGQASAQPIEVPHIFMHNHPSGLTFSSTDIESFIRRHNLFLLTAVGNDGSIYAVEKTDSYAAAEFVKAYIQEKLILDGKQTPAEYAEEMNLFLEGASRYGVQFVRRG